MGKWNPKAFGPRYHERLEKIKRGHWTGNAPILWNTAHLTGSRLVNLDEDTFMIPLVTSEEKDFTVTFNKDFTVTFNTGEDAADIKIPEIKGITPIVVMIDGYPVHCHTRWQALWSESYRVITHPKEYDAYDLNRAEDNVQIMINHAELFDDLIEEIDRLDEDFSPYHWLREKGLL